MLECIILGYEYTSDIFYKFTADAVRMDKISIPWYRFSLPTMIKSCRLSLTEGEQLLLGRGEGACSLTQDFLAVCFSVCCRLAI